MEQLSPRKRNKKVNELVRNFLLNERLKLANELRDNRYEIKKLAKRQADLKPMLTDINRQIDELGIRIDEDK